MYCHKCGTENLDGSNHCVACGQKLISDEANVAEANKVSLDKESSQSETSVSSEAVVNNEVVPVRSPMIWSILITVFGALTCCCLNPVSLILGIISLVFASRVDSKQRIGDYSGAKEDAKTAVMLNWIGLAFIILALLFGVVVVVISVINRNITSFDRL